jgi:hypothetical protein
MEGFFGLVVGLAVLAAFLAWIDRRDEPPAMP